MSIGLDFTAFQNICHWTERFLNGNLHYVIKTSDYKF